MATGLGVGSAAEADRDWEEWARRDPYYAVLTEERFRRRRFDAESRSAFFASGEGHVAAVFAIVERLVDAPFRPARCLDFGCGVGRTLEGLATRCAQVVGADVAASMLDEARRHCAAAGLSNVELVCLGDALAGLRGDFDLIHSALVFQHVERRRGEHLLAALLARLSPQGIAVLHFTTSSRVPLWASLLARARRSLRPLHAALNVATGRDARSPLMSMHVYEEARLLAIAAEQDCEVLARHPQVEDQYAGVILFLRRAKTEGASSTR